jgi:hypothetical protein
LCRSVSTTRAAGGVGLARAGGEEGFLTLVPAVAEPQVLLDHVRGHAHAVLARQIADMKGLFRES